METFILVLFFTAYAAILIFLILSVIYMGTLFFSVYYKVPYVGSKRHQLREILAEIKPQPGDTFYDLGSGDGRVVREAADFFKLNATGFEINPILVLFSRIRAHQAQSTAQYVRANILTVDLTKADIIYVFLLQFMLISLTPAFKEQCLKGTIIISHGFKIPGLASQLFKTLENKPFSTYYYKV